MFELDLCTGTLVIEDGLAIECTNDDCTDLSIDRHELVLTVRDVQRVRRVA